MLGFFYNFFFLRKQAADARIDVSVHACEWTVTVWKTWLAALKRTAVNGRAPWTQQTTRQGESNYEESGKWEVEEDLGIPAVHVSDRTECTDTTFIHAVFIHPKSRH